VRDRAALGLEGQFPAVPDIRVTLLGRFAVTVGGVPVAEAGWTRRHAAAVVKVLALAPGQRLHREQVIDLIWPDDTLAAAVPKLHKAAHYARHAIGVPDAVVLRDDQVMLCPRATVTVDAVEFEELARRALAGAGTGAVRRALGLYVGELLPADRYEERAEPRRDQLRQLHLDMLRLDGRWETVAELDPADERAHLALMRRYAGAHADRDRAARPGQVVAAGRHRRPGRGARPGVRPRDVRRGGGSVAVRAGHRGAGRSEPERPAVLGAVTAEHREQLDRARAGAPARWDGPSTHQRLLVAAAELTGAAAAARGLLLTIDDVHDADDASLRLLHYIARSARGQRVCIVLAHRSGPVPGTLDQLRRSLTARYGAAELPLGPLGERDTTTLIRRYVADPPAGLAGLIAALSRGNPFTVTELARRAADAAGPDWAGALRPARARRRRPGCTRAR
jgi:DNA-binding SARP family transcriptional activator